MPSLFDEYRTLLQLLDAVVERRAVEYENGEDERLTLRDLRAILSDAVAQVDVVEARS